MVRAMRVLAVESSSGILYAVLVTLKKIIAELEKVQGEKLGLWEQGAASI